MKLTDEQVDHIKALEDESGTLTPDAIVADARRKDSPLHSLFEWDKNKAAAAWWIECAREIIREVKLVITTTERELKVPYYVRDPDAVGQGYRAAVAMQRDPATARQALFEELTRAAGVITRARSVALALGLEGEVESMLDRILGLRDRLKAEDLAHAS